jgi:protein-tyrosine phosphatase
MVRILFVCLGNICRSPTAVGVARAALARAGLADRVVVDGAGTEGHHAGEAPDPRTLAHARARGYDLSGLRARRVAPPDFHAYDRLLALDRANLAELHRRCPPLQRVKLGLFLDLAPELGRPEVPDPWALGPESFEEVLDLCEAGARGLVRSLLEPHALRAARAGGIG